MRVMALPQVGMCNASSHAIAFALRLFISCTSDRNFARRLWF
jgi:hypothetical protein